VNTKPRTSQIQITLLIKSIKKGKPFYTIESPLQLSKRVLHWIQSTSTRLTYNSIANQNQQRPLTLSRKWMKVVTILNKNAIQILAIPLFRQLRKSTQQNSNVCVWHKNQKLIRSFNDQSANQQSRINQAWNKREKTEEPRNILEFNKGPKFRKIRIQKN